MARNYQKRVLTYRVELQHFSGRKEEIHFNGENKEQVIEEAVGHTSRRIRVQLLPSDIMIIGVYRIPRNLLKKPIRFSQTVEDKV
ncbi:MAG: hypothetical protein Q7S06_01815 [Nanoarchaeota archaeon]|nr:hypothetical protein [Nanoarchaeota archaeon]